MHRHNFDRFKGDDEYLYAERSEIRAPCPDLENLLAQLQEIKRKIADAGYLTVDCRELDDVSNRLHGAYVRIEDAITMLERKIRRR